MNPEQTTITGYVVAVVLTAITGTLAFLVRNAFSKFETTLDGVSKKLDELSASVARHDGDRRVTDANLRALEHRIEKLERQIEDLSEGGVAR